MNKLRWLYFLMLALFLIGTTRMSRAQTSDLPILELARTGKHLKEFVRLADFAGLGEMYNVGGPFTLIAFSDEAFALVPARVKNMVNTDQTKARQFLLHHTLTGSYASSQLATIGTIATGSGQNITVSSAADQILINGTSKLIFKDVQATNGIIHVLEYALNPGSGGVYAGEAGTGGQTGTPSGSGGAPAPNPEPTAPPVPTIGEMTGNGAGLGDPNNNSAYVSGGYIAYSVGVNQGGNVCQGMTFTVLQQEANVTLVGADRKTNPYRGDTSCSEARPLLCHFRNGAGAPSSKYAAAWSYGQAKATTPIVGSDLKSQEIADGICTTVFGGGWRMAEFHLGTGGQFWAFGNLPLGQRFWVRIYDQPAHPWDSYKPFGGTGGVPPAREIRSPSQNPSWMGPMRTPGEQRAEPRQWCKGMTWVVLRQYNGLVQVGGDAMTNAYRGDRSCPESLPLLCMNVTGAPAPANGQDDYGNGWSAATVKLTSPVTGTSLSTREIANRLCLSSFGAGWKVANFHAGSLGELGTDGWDFWSYDGGLRGGTRFWVGINDQYANPWNG